MLALPLAVGLVALGVATHLHLAVVEVGGAGFVLVVLLAFAERAIERGDLRRRGLLDLKPVRRLAGWSIPARTVGSAGERAGPGRGDRWSAWCHTASAASGAP